MIRKKEEEALNSICVVCRNEILPEEKKVNLSFGRMKDPITYHLEHFLSWLILGCRHSNQIALDKNNLEKLHKDVRLALDLEFSPKDLNSLGKKFFEDVDLAIEKRFIPHLYKTIVERKYYCEKTKKDVYIFQCVTCNKDCKLDFHFRTQRNNKSNLNFEI